MTAMKAAHPRVSVADMEKWPEDGRRYELYDGEVYEVPSPILLHQMVSARLYLALAAYVNTHGGTVLYAPLDIVLTEHRAQRSRAQAPFVADARRARILAGRSRRRDD
jgi:Uma2 family endonuclease